MWYVLEDVSAFGQGAACLAGFGFGFHVLELLPAKLRRGVFVEPRLRTAQARRVSPRLSAAVDGLSLCESQLTEASERLLASLKDAMNPCVGASASRQVRVGRVDFPRWKERVLFVLPGDSQHAAVACSVRCCRSC